MLLLCTMQYMPPLLLPIMLSTMPQLPTTLSIMPQLSTMLSIMHLPTMPLPLSTTNPTTVMSNPSITAQFKMLLRLLKFAPQLLRLSATPLSLPSRLLLTKNSATQSLALSVPRALRRLTTRSAPTLTNRRLRPQLPRLSRLLLRSSVTPRWLLSASQPQDTDTTAMDTTTARRLPGDLLQCPCCHPC